MNGTRLSKLRTYNCHTTRWSAGRMLLLGLLAAGLVGGCSKSEPKPPPAEVKVVEAYGVKLDASAGPQQVVYVFLRSVADDYAAARAKDAAAQRKAQLVAYSLAAPSVIEQRLVDTANLINPNLKKTSLGDERDEKIFKAVHSWAPIVGHYLPSFAKADLQTVVRESWAMIGADGQRSQVYYPVSHDPTLEPAKTQTATIDVELIRQVPQAGGPELWRIATVRFLGKQIIAPLQPVTVQAYGLTLDESATPQQVASVMLRSLAQMAQADKAQAIDLRTSAMYRAYSLMAVAQVKGRLAAAGKANDAETLANVAKNWAARVVPVLAEIEGNAAPDKLQAAGNTDGTATVTYVPAGKAAAVSVQLMPQSLAGKTWWRVSDVSTAGAGTAPAAASAPAK